MKKKLVSALALMAATSLILTGCWSEAAVERDTDGAALIASEEEAEEGEEEEEEANAEEGRHISPLPETFNVNDPADGTYPAKFEVADFNLEDKELNVTLYSVDLYDMRDINMMQIGDVLEYDGRNIVVELIEDKSGHLEVNGGLDKGGCSLWPHEDDTYIARIENDYPTFSELIKTSLPLSDSLFISDSFNNPSKPVETDMEGLETYLSDMDETSGKSFYRGNTTVEIRSGKIVNITRVWTP